MANVNESIYMKIENIKPMDLPDNPPFEFPNEDISDSVTQWGSKII